VSINAAAASSSSSKRVAASCQCRSVLPLRPMPPHWLAVAPPLVVGGAGMPASIMGSHGCGRRATRAGGPRRRRGGGNAALLEVALHAVVEMCVVIVGAIATVRAVEPRWVCRAAKEWDRVRASLGQSHLRAAPTSQRMCKRRALY